MIQRIQTIYLLLAGVLSGLFAFMPLLYFSTSDGGLFDIYARGVAAGGSFINEVVYLWILAGGATLLPIVNIFLFKNRMAQVRLCIVNVVLLLGNYLLLGTYFFMAVGAFKEIGIESRGFHPAVFASLVSIVLVLFAAKAIFRDEMLVRSVDRIR
ncbi:MAG: DUF4293 domain-containing protein [Rikenellaceae bacterium]